MSILKMFRASAPTHTAEKYWPCHDGTLNIVEARRGRGKSFGAVKIAVEWLRERMPDMIAGRAPFARVYTNIRFDRRRFALVLCLLGICRSHRDALRVYDERIVFCESWDDMLIAYDSLVLLDEANRNLDSYDSSKNVQSVMKMIHDWAQQTRKHRLTMYFLVQDLSWLKNQVVVLADRLWRAKRVRVKGTQRVRYFPWYGGDPFAKGKGAEVVRRADFKMRFDFDLRLARVYDTLQAVKTWAPEARWNSFGELSDYMLLHGLKPLPSNHIPDAPTWEEVETFFSREALSDLPTLPLHGGGWGGGRGTRTQEHYLSDVFDPSKIALSFPSEQSS